MDEAYEEEADEGEAELLAAGDELMPAAQDDCAEESPQDPSPAVQSCGMDIPGQEGKAAQPVSADQQDTLPFELNAKATPSPSPVHGAWDVVAVDERISFLKILGRLA